MFLVLTEDDDVFFQAMNRRTLFYVLMAPVVTEELLGWTVTQERSGQRGPFTKDM